jgi:uncharacterized membrane protein YqaE (UPF0057 family)
MKRNYIFLSLCLSLTVLTSFNSFAAKSNENSARGSQSISTARVLEKNADQGNLDKDRSSVKVEKKNQKQVRHEIKSKLENARKNKSDVDEIILILLAIFLPPVAVYLVDDLTTPFWIDLILTLLFFLPGMIFALYRVLKSGGKI